MRKVIIPTKDKNPGIVDAGVKAADKFKKPRLVIQKFKSKGDTIE